MPKKTLALIAGLVLVTVILFIIALRTGQDQSQMTQQQANATPTEAAKRTSLSLSPSQVQVASGKTGSVDVLLDNVGDPITGAELDLLYDPAVVTNVKVEANKLFATGVILKNKNDAATGLYVYSFALQPGQKPVTTAGAIATITFTATGPLGKQTQILFDLKKSIVTQQGVTTSVMNEAKGTTIVIVAPTTPTTAVKPSTLTPTTVIKKTTTPAVPPPVN